MPAKLSSHLIKWKALTVDYFFSTEFPWKCKHQCLKVVKNVTGVCWPTISDDLICPSSKQELAQKLESRAFLKRKNTEWWSQIFFCQKITRCHLNLLEVTAKLGSFSRHSIGELRWFVGTLPPASKVCLVCLLRTLKYSITLSQQCSATEQMSST